MRDKGARVRGDRDGMEGRGGASERERAIGE